MTTLIAIKVTVPPGKVPNISGSFKHFESPHVLVTQQ